MGIMIGCDILDSPGWNSNYVTAWSSNDFKSFNSHANIAYI